MDEEQFVESGVIYDESFLSASGNVEHYKPDHQKAEANIHDGATAMGLLVDVPEMIVSVETLTSLFAGMGPRASD